MGLVVTMQMDRFTQQKEPFHFYFGTQKENNFFSSHLKEVEEGGY